MNATTAQRQLSLAVRLRDDATLDNFLALPPVAPLLDAVRNQSEADGEAVIFLYGPEGTGKSHLLQAACQEDDGSSVYLPMQDLGGFSPSEVLQGIEGAHRVCIDDLHTVMGQPEWERALFNFYNLARERECRLLLSATMAPRELPTQLEDLRSRLSWGVVYQLVEGDDEDKVRILRFRAGRRGMSLPDGVARFIVSRAHRGLTPLLAILDELDRVSLSEKRVLSIPFVKQTLGW